MCECWARLYSGAARHQTSLNTTGEHAAAAGNTAVTHHGHGASPAAPCAPCSPLQPPGSPPASVCGASSCAEDVDGWKVVLKLVQFLPSPNVHSHFICSSAQSLAAAVCTHRTLCTHRTTICTTHRHHNLNLHSVSEQFSNK